MDDLDAHNSSASATLVSTIGRWTTGKVVIEFDDAARRFINRPTGYVSPAMVRDTLAAAARFGEQHPQGWSYIVVTSALLIPNPMNAIHLHEIPKLPNIAQYAIVAPNPFVRLLAHGMKFVSHPDAVVASLNQVP